LLKISIIIAVYNKESYILRTLQSVLNQTYTDFEIIIVNDGSIDNSEYKILELSDSRIKYYKQENQGAGAARNMAISKASSKYIALLDADDIWDKNYLNEQVKLIKKYPSEFVFACAILTKKGNKEFAKPYAITESKEGRYDYFKNSLKTSILHSSSTILRKEVFENIGLYNPKIKSGQDTDLYIRIGLKYKIVFNPKALVIYTINNDSLWRSIKTVKDRTHFEQYNAIEQTNSSLKKFLDINRFSLAIEAKIRREKNYFKKIVEKIDLNNLNRKQRFLLKQPTFMLKLFFNVKNNLEKLGLRFTIFG